VAALLVLCGSASLAAPKPGWWEQAHTEAVHDGYRLISVAGLDRLLKAEEPLLLLDVRPGYEFKAGHLPDSLNLEFHLGDRNRLSPAKQKALTKILGPDLERRVVIYCRSYQ
jgi:phage shock protein E